MNSKERYGYLVFALMAFLAATCQVRAQQTPSAPLPPDRYAWLALDPSSAATTPAEGDNKKKDNELDFLEQDIKQLSQTRVNAPAMDLEVTSVSKQPSTVGKSPAAIFVITQEDLRRSGVTSIPEALRMVPGIQVARIDANKWTIGSRGFGTRFTNKLLVLMDGRTIYTPLYSGVFWDTQDTVLEDIDRIEVIRGPGATMWEFARN